MASIQIPVSDSIPTPRGSTECRSNAQRSRQQSDWFSHDSASGPQVKSSGKKTLPHTSASGNSLTVPGSSDSFTGRPESPSRAAAGLSSAETRGSNPNAKRNFSKQHDVMNGDSQGWYKYGADHRDEIIGRSSKASHARGTLEGGTEIKKKMTACDSNEWFRHEHIPGEVISPRISSAGHQGRRHPKSPLCNESTNSPLWAASKTDSDEGIIDVRQVVSSPEASEYLKRNKTGTTSEWFPHEHAADSDGNLSSASQRQKGGKECAENATRLKGESSQTWFSHEPNQNYTAPSPQPKLTTPEARLLMEKAKGDEMRQVLRMDQNLKTTWTVPSSASCYELPDLQPLKVNDVSENNHAIMDKFINNQKMSNGEHDGMSVDKSISKTDATV